MENKLNRRDFLHLMGLVSSASLLNSCLPERQTEKLIPYLVPPDDGTIRGVAHYTSTMCRECPSGCGATARVMDYQASKLEGIEGHPINDGGLCARGQASISRLRHPDRIKGPLAKDANGNFAEITWDEAYTRIASTLRGSVGESSDTMKNVYLSGRVTGTLSGLLDRFGSETGVERLPAFELYGHSAIREANRVLFGRAEVPSYRIEDADFLLTIGADVLETFTSPVSHGAQYGRAKAKPDFEWYHAEPHVSLTGLQAKERFVIAPGSEAYLLTYVLRKVSRANLGGDRHIAGIVESLPDLSARGFAEKTGLDVDDIDRIADHLIRAGSPLVIVGGVSTMQAAAFEVALLAGLLQWATGMMGKTVDFENAENYDNVGSLKDLEDLKHRLDEGRIRLIILSNLDIVGGPVASLGFDKSLEKATLRVGLGETMTATMSACDIVLPLSHTLESWGDAVPRRGIVNVVQPAIEPMNDTRSEGDILLGLLAKYQNTTASSYQEYLFARWNEKYGASKVGELLANGYLRTGAANGAVELNKEEAAGRIHGLRFEDPPTKALIVAPSLRVFDGRSKDLPLMNEVPDPLSTVTWGGYVSISEESATEAGLRTLDEVTLSSNGWSVDLPVMIQYGLRRGMMVVQCGDASGMPVESDALAGEMIATLDEASLTPTGRTVALPVLSGSKSQQGRGVIPKPGDHEPHIPRTKDGKFPTLFPEQQYKEYRWGMAIDLDLCTGCSACAAACYVENNLAVTGPELHLQGREMSWIRIEPFYDDERESADFQPMLCQHCTNAPCEAVCPVYATYHNEEGINAQVYNRCVGTRYCLNNCPYKVRRFNWFDFRRPSDLNLTRNPEVSVRGRGVMEKCTFCVQRVRSARDKAKDAGRPIQDGELSPACAQTCPTNAIVFGNLLDENSEVSKWTRSDRAYRVFDQLGTQPAVTYLKNEWKNGDHENHG